MEFISNTNNLILLALMIVSGASLLAPYIPGIIQGKHGLSPALATALINRTKAVIFDIRSSEEFQKGHLARAKNVQPADVISTLASAKVDKTTPILLICDTGIKAGALVSKLKNEGFTEVVTLEGGIKAWNQAGLPLVQS